MELCPKCKRMTAERNHNTGTIICYNKFCDQQTNEFQSLGDVERPKREKKEKNSLKGLSLK